MYGDTEVITLHTVLIICCALLRRSSHYSRHIAEIGLSCILLTIRHIERFEMVFVPPNEPHTYLLIYLLTPGSRVLLGKLTGSQLVKKFPAFCGTRRFITECTSARHLSLSWARSIHSMPSHFTSRRSTLIKYLICWCRNDISQFSCDIWDISFLNQPLKFS